MRIAVVLTLGLVYSSSFSLFMCILILLTSGFKVFTSGNWDPSAFVSSYLYASSFSTHAPNTLDKSFKARTNCYLGIYRLYLPLM